MLCPAPAEREAAHVDLVGEVCRVRGRRAVTMTVVGWRPCPRQRRGAGPQCAGEAVLPAL